MSRSKGYKCFNIKCGSCIGKALCGEPEDTALVCVDRVIGKPMTNADRIRAMSDEELAKLLCCTGWRMIEQKECLEWLQMPEEEDDDKRELHRKAFELMEEEEGAD